MKPTDATGTTYLQVRQHPSYGHELRVIKCTQKHPAQTEPGCVVVKVSLQIPRSAFQPLEAPEIVVPEHHVALGANSEPAEEE
ncbi:hypothetical protein [Sciscionella sediminilitoris]|uniref:hypothetical protein n=1 Tax=Sciscionella sediminilitoris TaxID=1445613 RepID=UPI0004DF0A9F|nr:hypothetical protein [Sciscionella sp. SE31]